MISGNKLTPAEWEIMNTVWNLGGSPSVRDVLENAYPNGEKAYTTIQTLMNLLEKKGLLTRKKIGLVNFYTPATRREDMLQRETEHLISRVFRGSAPALANFLIAEEDLSLDDIQHIKALLKEKEAQLREK
ncbi:MAG: BlaI/MecI/CopY family transcriptional regulator [Candidatus Marinimicrobia bacterium]|nr:BlaI/MecI/CopY family transcriptional regulator [Candidatus Neomarinimicrobiota bacterium]